MSTPIRKKNITSWEADGAIAANVIVVCDAEGKVKTGAAANDANIKGVSIQAASDGGHVDVAGNGDIVWLKAGAAVTHGERIVCGDSSGRGIDCPASSGTVYHILGYARGSVSNADELFPVEISLHEFHAP